MFCAHARDSHGPKLHVRLSLGQKEAPSKATQHRQDFQPVCFDYYSARKGTHDVKKWQGQRLNQRLVADAVALDVLLTYNIGQGKPGTHRLS